MMVALKSQRRRVALAALASAAAFAYPHGGQAASGTVHDVVTSLFGSAVVASVLALLADLKLPAG